MTRHRKAGCANECGKAADRRGEAGATIAAMAAATPEMAAARDNAAVAFITGGSVLTMYLQSGKKKHDRYFWIEGARHPPLPHLSVAHRTAAAVGGGSARRGGAGARGATPCGDRVRRNDSRLRLPLGLAFARALSVSFSRSLLSHHPPALAWAGFLLGDKISWDKKKAKPGSQ